MKLTCLLEAELNFSEKNCHEAFFFFLDKGHTNEMTDLVQLMTQTLKLDSKESYGEPPNGSRVKI